MTDKPNIVIIMSDQHTPNVTGCYGNDSVYTPNLDRISENGVMFNNAYCNNPVCVPSRMSMLTGLHSHSINVWCNSDPLLPHLVTWPLLLRLAGYETVISGRNHMLWGDRLGGFSHRLCGDKSPVIPFVQENATMLGGKAPQALETNLGPAESTHYALHDIEANQHAMNYLKTPHNTPFALFIGYYQPHAPFTCQNEFFEKYQDFDPPLHREETVEPVYKNLIRRLQLNRDIDNEKLSTAIKAYYGMVSHVDTLVGEIADTMETNGLLENTILIYTSDHGEMLGRHRLWHKMNFYEDSVRVPLIITNPKRFGKQRQIDKNVSLIDLFPTFMDIASVEENISLDGHSLLPLLEEVDTEWDNRVIAESIGVVRGEPGIMLKRDQFKLILYHNNDPILFNLESDPLEHCNLADDNEYADILKSMIAEATRNWHPAEINAAVNNNLKHIYYHHKVSRLDYQ